MDTKTCTKCGETKPLDAFYKNGNYLRSECKTCSNAASVKWDAKNPEKAKAKRAKWNAKNPEKVNAKRARWRAKNPEKVKARTAKGVDEVTPAYVAGKLHIPLSDLTPELYAMKREQILNHRALKALTETLKEIQDEQRTDPDERDPDNG